MRASLVKQSLMVEAGGAGGIRTLDTVLPYTHFPGERLRPLGHRSAFRWKAAHLGGGSGWGKVAAGAPHLLLRRPNDPRRAPLRPNAVRRRHRRDRPRD